MSDVPEVPVDQLPADAVLLDVREPKEWTAGHAEGAVHIPLGELPARLGELPDARPVYVVCRSGGRSSRAMQWLGEQGVAAVNVAGGTQAWAGAGRPMVSHNGLEPTVA